MFHAVWNFYAKKSAANKIVLIWAAQFLTGILLIPVAFYLIWIQGLSSQAIFYLLASCAIHSVYVYLLGSAYELGEISTVYPVARGVGIAGTAVLATLLSVDSITLIGVLGITSIIAGVVTIGICKTRLQNSNKVIGISTLVGLFIASYSVVDKMAVSHISPLLFVALVHLGSPLLLSFWIVKKLKSETMEVLSYHKLYAIYIGAASIGTYVLILWAFQSTPASYVVALRETSILFATLLGVLVLKDKFSFQKAIGVSVIILGAILMKFA